MKALKLLAVVAAFVSTAVSAQNWPSKPVKLIVPYAAGSGPDTAMRPVAERLGTILGQPVVIVNYSMKPMPTLWQL